jgi:hypothetical protein
MLKKLTKGLSACGLIETDAHELSELTANLQNWLELRGNAHELKASDFRLERALIRIETRTDIELYREILKMIRSDAKCIYQDDEYFVYSAMMKKPASTLEYRAVWLIGIDPHQQSGFWVHRLPWHAEFKRDNFQRLISQAKIKQWLGFKGDLERDSSQIFKVEKGEWCRIVGDIRMRLIRDLDDHLNGNILVRRLIADEHLHRKHRELMETITVSEEELRKYQRTQGWKILTARRRKIATSELTWRLAEELIKTEYAEKLAKMKMEEATSIRENLSSQALRIADHIIYMKNALRWTNRWRTLNYWVDGEILFYHPEHGEREITVPLGLYEFDRLPRHITQLPITQRR